MFHIRSQCMGDCPLHNPSDHHMKGWTLNWRAWHQAFERVCSHGVGHPDPDSNAWLRSKGKPEYSIHGCDGCCKGEA